MITGSEEGLQFWESHIEAQRASGKSVLKYSQEHGIADHRLLYWKSKLFKKQKEGGQIERAKFISIGEKESYITVTVPSGLMVKLPTSIPGEKLLSVVQCLLK